MVTKITVNTQCLPKPVLNPLCMLFNHNSNHVKQVITALQRRKLQHRGIKHIVQTHSWCGRRQWHPTPVLLPGKSPGWRSLEGCSPGVAKSRTRLSNFTFTFMHWRRKWQPTPVFLPGESQGRGSLVGCCLWGHTESDTTEAIQQQQHSWCTVLQNLISSSLPLTPCYCSKEGKQVAIFNTFFFSVPSFRHRKGFLNYNTSLN